MSQRQRMTDKAAISDLTWRSLESQRKALGDLPCFVLPDELSYLMRKTQRAGTDRIHVVSLGVIADNEKAFRAFLSLAKQRKCQIVSQEENKTFSVNGGHDDLVKWWKDARRSGAAKAGAKISARLKRQKSSEGVAKIKDRWPLSSKEWPTKVLLAEADVSLNTAKAYLGSRPIAQYNLKGKHHRQLRSLELDEKPREKSNFCGLYVFRVDDGVFKIGFSGNARTRFKHISQYQKKKMKIVAIYNMEKDKAVALENEVHNRLHKYRDDRYNGREIFKVSLERIKRTIKQATKYLFEVPDD